MKENLFGFFWRKKKGLHQISEGTKSKPLEVQDFLKISLYWQWEGAPSTQSTNASHRWWERYPMHVPAFNFLNLRRAQSSFVVVGWSWPVAWRVGTAGQPDTAMWSRRVTWIFHPGNAGDGSWLGISRDPQSSCHHRIFHAITVKRRNNVKFIKAQTTKERQNQRRLAAKIKFHCKKRHADVHLFCGIKSYSPCMYKIQHCAFFSFSSIDLKVNRWWSRIELPNWAISAMVLRDGGFWVIRWFHANSTWLQRENRLP